MAVTELALERRFPQLAGRLPRVALTALPTPVQQLERLGRAQGIERLWIKRDDQSGVLYGGNKPRKLELLLGAARQRGRRSVMTFGGIGTHHGLATAIGARVAGLRTILVLLRQPVTAHVRRCLLLDYAYGAELHYAPTVAGVAASAARLYARGWLNGDRPEVIPTGGTSALGTIGYVNAALELAEQVERAEVPEPDAIFVPLGSGGTAAGLMLGLKLAGLRSRVVGVLVTDILPPSARRLARLARASQRRLRRLAPEIPDVTVSASDLTIVTEFCGAGYGAPSAEAEAAQRLAADIEGLQLETTYTAKCAAALLHLARAPAYRGRTLLFWNTYSSVDPGAQLERLPDFHELPPAFHQFFSDDAAPVRPGNQAAARRSP
ncbi:MAG: pyridoxal-phosphate dependent enzyme [Deltaproteobacteria bacterium]|nr:pyridoxal-phosphate dependent enzyme [Deltaproteobacteria bacterium]